MSDSQPDPVWTRDDFAAMYHQAIDERDASNDLLKEALAGLEEWTSGYSESSMHEVCMSCGRGVCRTDCKCKDLIQRIKKVITP